MGLNLISSGTGTVLGLRRTLQPALDLIPIPFKMAFFFHLAVYFFKNIYLLRSFITVVYLRVLPAKWLIYTVTVNFILRPNLAVTGTHMEFSLRARCWQLTPSTGVACFKMLKYGGRGHAVSSRCLHSKDGALIRAVFGRTFALRPSPGYTETPAWSTCTGNAESRTDWPAWGLINSGPLISHFLLTFSALGLQVWGVLWNRGRQCINKARERLNGTADIMRLGYEIANNEMSSLIKALVHFQGNAMKPSGEFNFLSSEIT